MNTENIPCATVLDLPTNILETVFNLLDQQSRSAAACSCHRFNSIIQRATLDEVVLDLHSLQQLLAFILWAQQRPSGSVNKFTLRIKSPLGTEHSFLKSPALRTAMVFPSMFEKMLRPACMGSGLKHLDISSSIGQVVVNEWILGLPHLESLCVSTEVVLTMADCLAEAQNLKVLKVSRSWKRMPVVGGMQLFMSARWMPPRLKELHLSCVSLWNALPTNLQDAHELTKIILHGTKNHDFDTPLESSLEALWLVPNLKCLALTHSSLNEFPKSVSKMTGLTALDLSGMQLLGDDSELAGIAASLRNLAPLTNLKLLSLASCNLGELDSTLFRLPALEQLWLTNNKGLTFPLFSDDAYCTGFEQYTSILAGGSDRSAGMTTLRYPTCDLKALEIDLVVATNHAYIFERLPHLEVLQLYWCSAHRNIRMPLCGDQLFDVFESIDMLPNLEVIRFYKSAYDALDMGELGAARLWALARKRPSLLIQFGVDEGWDGNPNLEWRELKSML